MAKQINDSNYKEILATPGAVVIDFWAQWCGPCKKVGPEIDKLSEAYEGKAVIGKCDVDESEELPAKMGIRNIPTILFIKDGEVVDKQVGAATYTALEEKLKNIL